MVKPRISSIIEREHWRGQLVKENLSMADLKTNRPNHVRGWQITKLFNLLTFDVARQSTARRKTVTATWESAVKLGQRSVAGLGLSCAPRIHAEASGRRWGVPVMVVTLEGVSESMLMLEVAPCWLESRDWITVGVITRAVFSVWEGNNFQGGWETRPKSPLNSLFPQKQDTSHAALCVYLLLFTSIRRKK